MRFSTRVTALAIMVSLPATAHAQSKCMAQAEAAALFSFALPELIDTVADKCSNALPPQAYLRNQGAGLVKRYRAEAAPAWPQAKAAFLKTMGSDDKNAVELFNALPDDTVKTLIGTSLAAAVGGDVKPENCGNIDRIAGSLAPLSLSQLSTLFLGIIIMADKKKDSSLKICPAG